jgi:hypothetical protein
MVMKGWPERGIGVSGTVARVAVGVAFVGGVLYSQAAHGWRPLAWLLGLVGFSIIEVAVLGLRARRQSLPLRATGPLGHLANICIFFALYLTRWYAPPLAVLSDAALIFYGGSMLLAAARGYAGCEVLAVSNWVPRRDDEVGCALFWPVDTAEARTRELRPPGTAAK